MYVDSRLGSSDQPRGEHGRGIILSFVRRAVMSAGVLVAGPVPTARGRWSPRSRSRGPWVLERALFRERGICQLQRCARGVLAVCLYFCCHASAVRTATTQHSLPTSSDWIGPHPVVDISEVSVKFMSFWLLLESATTASYALAMLPGRPWTQRSVPRSLGLSTKGSNMGSEPCEGK